MFGIGLRKRALGQRWVAQEREDKILSRDVITLLQRQELNCPCREREVTVGEGFTW